MTVDSTGDVTGGYDGIYVDTDGAITIISEGNVTATTNDALDADGAAGDVSVTSTGDILAGTLDGTATHRRG